LHFIITREYLPSIPQISIIVFKLNEKEFDIAVRVMLYATPTVPKAYVAWSSLLEKSISMHQML
jgi:hypothetical protein